MPRSDSPSSRHAAGDRPRLLRVLAGPGRPWLVLLLVILAACPGEDAGKTATAPVSTGPNVLILVMDTTRVDRCGFGGYTRPTTPGLDALAREGVVFRNAWSPSSWTGPSHASLFTGVLPPRHGFMMGNLMYLDEGARTIAEILADAGYRTACYSNNHIVSPEWGLAQGFEYHVPFYDRGPRSVSRSLKTHEAAARWALGVHRRGEKFFLFINDMEPHLPYSPPPPFEGRFVPPGLDRKVIDEARAFENPRHLLYCLRRLELEPARLSLLSDLYDGEIATLDASISWLVEKLRSEGVLDETLLIVTADHGEALGEHHMLGHNLSLAPWLLHVPLLVRYPGAFDGGRTVEDLVRLEDVMPTCLELCGLEVPDGLDGRTLTGGLEGRIARAFLGPPMAAEVHDEVTKAQATRFLSSIRSVRDGRHHLLLYSDGRVALHDLEADPGETENLADREPDVVRRLTALLSGD